MPLHSKNKSNFSSDRYLDSDPSTEDFLLWKGEGKKGRSDKREKRWQKKQQQRMKRIEEEKTPEQKELETLYQRLEKVFDGIIECNNGMEPVAGWENTPEQDGELWDELVEFRRERSEIEARIKELKGTIPDPLSLSLPQWGMMFCY